MSESKKVKVVFVADAGPREGGDFKEGKAYEMTEDSAARWIKRGRAVTADDYKAIQKAKKDAK